MLEVYRIPPGGEVYDGQGKFFDADMSGLIRAVTGKTVPDAGNHDRPGFVKT
jgi:hypothetical protein